MDLSNLKLKVISIDFETGELTLQLPPDVFENGDIGWQGNSSVQVDITQAIIQPL